MDGDIAVIVAGDIAALLFACFSASVVLRLTGSSKWRVAAQRALGPSLIALAAFLLMRQALPDLFAIPFVFFIPVAIDILTMRRFVRPAERYVISFLISLSIVGSLLTVDILMRTTGHHLTALI